MTDAQPKDFFDCEFVRSFTRHETVIEEPIWKKARELTKPGDKLYMNASWVAKPERFQFKSYRDTSAMKSLFFVKFGNESLNGTSVHGGSIAHLADEVMCVAAHLNFVKDANLKTWLGYWPATAQIVLNIRRPAQGSKIILFCGSVDKHEGNKYYTKFTATDESSAEVADGTALIILKRFR